MKKVIVIVLLVAMAAVVCVGCSQGKPATKKFDYTVYNETGKLITAVTLADDKGTSSIDVKFSSNGFENGAKVGVSVDAVPGSDGNPSVTLTYTIDGNQRTIKVTGASREIRITQ